MGCSASIPSSTDIIAQGTPGSSHAQDQAVRALDEQAATQLLHRYTKPRESIWAALETGELVRAGGRLVVDHRSGHGMLHVGA